MISKQTAKQLTEIIHKHLLKTPIMSYVFDKYNYGLGKLRIKNEELRMI